MTELWGIYLKNHKYANKIFSLIFAFSEEIFAEADLQKNWNKTHYFDYILIIDDMNMLHSPYSG